MLITSIVAVSVVSDTTDAKAVWYDDFDKAPEVPKNPTSGDVCKVGDQTYSDFSTALNEAIETGQELVLLVDFTIEKMDVVSELVIDLNQHTLAFDTIATGTSEDGTSVANLTIKNGTLYGQTLYNEEDKVDCTRGSISVYSECTVELSNVRYYTEATALYVCGLGATANVVNGTVIHAIGFCIGTNASGPENHGVIINVSGSSLYADEIVNGAQAAILFNVPGNLNITDSTIQGYCQGVIVRGGTAVIQGSEIVNTMVDQSPVFTFADDANWGSGNYLPNGGLVIGNKNPNSYQYPSDVSLTDTKITCDGKKASYSPAIYAYSNESEGNGIELVYENCAFTNDVVLDNIVLANEESGNIVAGTPVAKIGDRGFASLQAAFDAAGNGEKIVLVADIEDCPRITLDDGDDYVLNLNGHTVTFAQNAYFDIKKASLSVTGSGTIKEGSPYYGVFMIKNTADATPGNKYIHLTIGENVTAQGWAPVFIDDPATSGGNAYGVTVDVYGKLVSVLDTAGAGGHAIYINGQNTSMADYPVINIYDGAKITSNANGVYIAGYTEFNMYGGSITGVNVGIEIRAGILNIKGGSIEATSNTFSTTSNGNGSTTSGVAVAVSQHTTALNIDVNITDGDLKGLYALYQASMQMENDSTKVDMSVTGGTFTTTDTTGQYASVGAEDKTRFITGGEFSDSIDGKYIAFGFELTEKADGGYSVEDAGIVPTLAVSESSPQQGDAVTATITIPGLGDQEVSYAWTFNGTAITGSETCTFAPDRSGTLSVIVTVITGGTEKTFTVSTEITVTLPSPPTDPEGGETTVVIDENGDTVTTTTRPDGSKTETTESTIGDDIKTETVVETPAGSSDSQTVTTVVTVPEGGSVSNAVVNEAIGKIENSSSGDTDKTLAFVSETSGSVDIPVSSLSDISDAGVSLSLTSSDVTVTFSPSTIETISQMVEETTGATSLKTTAENASGNLNQSQSATVGDATVYDVSAFLVDDNDDVLMQVSRLGDMTPVTIPYELPTGISPEDVVVYYMDDYGNLTSRTTVYEDGMVTFWTEHFSYYVIGDRSMIDDEPDIPDYPSFIPGGDDDVYVPPTIVVDQSSSDDDESVKVAACAAAAVAAAILACLIIMERRKG